MSEFEDRITAEYNAERKALEALDGEICATFGAIWSPSLDDLAGILARHGWLYDPEPANPNSRPDA